MYRKNLLVFTALVFVLLTGCLSTVEKNLHEPIPYVQVTSPDWLKTASIYQINTRQFTQQGTFNAAANQLPRLKKLGVDILWLMPIHPIGEQNRKGSLGSPYSIKDYLGVNPEFGTLDDFKQFVEQAHELGMYVILDWVANHTAWDNDMRLSHPEWYVKDHNGNFTPTPWYDWDDIIDLDFEQKAVREYMSNAMQFWVREMGVDGFRSDAAGLLPLQFWEDVRVELDAIKPVFMLAEWEGRDFHAKAFDATYAWSWWKGMHDIAKGKANLDALYAYYSWNTGYYPQGLMRLTYISNHDSNAWEATQFEAFGDALESAIVLSVIGEGIPMIYNGQEAGNTKRLAFFERDPIEWQEHAIGKLYQQLFALKKSNSVLWNGKWGAPMIPVANNNNKFVLSFIRQNENDKVFAVFNMSAQPQTVNLAPDSLYEGEYQEYFGKNVTNIKSGQTFELAPWEFNIYIKN
jgi:glycosidase